MNKHLIICFLVTLISSGVLCESDVESRKATKLEFLSELTERSIPFLAMDKYLRYAMNVDSTYDVITLFTLKNTAGGRCQMCDTGYRILKLLGRALRKKEHPIFVVGVDIETQGQLASMLGIERMPLVHIRSKANNLDEFYPMNQHLEIELLQRWILVKTGVEVKLKVPTDYKKIVGMVTYALFLVLLVYLVYKYLRKYIGRNIIGIVAVYMCVVFTAGMKYTLINNSPYKIKNANGEMETLANGQHDQTVAECYMICFLCKYI